MRCFLEKEYLYKIVQEKLPPEMFLKFQQNYEKQVPSHNNEYELLSSIRRVIRKSLGKLAEDEVFKIGILVFETFLKENVADKSCVLVNMAFLHEGLNHAEKADECLRNALSSSLDKEFVITKVGNFFCQTAEKGIANPVERVKAVFQFSSANNNYTYLISNQIENAELTYRFYQQFKKFTGNTNRELIFKIQQEKQTALPQLEVFLDRMKVLAEVYKITVDTYFLGQVVQKALRISWNYFIKQQELKLSSKCVILEIKCLEIFISRNINDYYNYFLIAGILKNAKEYKLHLYSDNNDKQYYDNHKMYVDKAIELGRNTLENQGKNDANLKKTCRNVVNAYLLRGDLGLEIALEDYKQAVELAFNAGNPISLPNLLDFIGRFFIEKYDSTHDVSFLFIGFAVFKTLVHRSIIVEDDIKTLVANFYKYYKPSPIDNLKNIPSARNQETSHNQIKTLSNNESKAFILGIQKGKGKNLFERLKQSVDTYYKVFLNKMVVSAFKNIGKTFLEQNMHYLSSRCVLMESKCTEKVSASKDIDDKLDSDFITYYLSGGRKIELALNDYTQASDLSREFLDISYAPSSFDYICRFFTEELNSDFKILTDLAVYCIHLGLADKATNFMRKARPVNEDNRRRSYNHLRDLIGNDPKSFTSKILNGKNEIFSGLQNLLEETKELVEVSGFKIDVDYLDKVVMSSIHSAGQIFREQENYEFFHKCLILEIKCNEIFIAAKGYHDFTNFVNFHAIATILNTARKQEFFSFPEAEKYYKEYKVYIEKAIELGKKAVEKVSRIDSNFPKFVSSLADAYRLRGDLNVIEDERSSFKDYQKSVELFEFMGNIIYEDSYLDWAVDRLATSYFSIKQYEKALEAYKILFDKSEVKKYQAALGIGNVYEAMGNFPEARNYYLECLGISKEDPAAYSKLMNLHRNYGNYDEAIKWLQKINGFKYCKPGIKFGNLRIMAELIKEKRLYKYRDVENQCIKEIEAFVNKNIEEKTSMTSENDVYIGNIEDFKFTFKKEISYLADHYLDNGFFKKAHKFIQMLLGSSKPKLQNDKVYLNTKAKILIAEERWEDAEIVIRKNIEENGETTRNISSLGNVFRNKKEFSQAVECFRKAYIQDKHRAPADQIGATYREWAKETVLSGQMKQELKKKAIEWYLEIKEDHPEDTRIPYGLAKSYLLEPLKKEDIDKGVAILTDMLSKNNDRKAIKELLYLWSNNLNNTIEKIILNNYEIGVSGSSHSFLICEIIKISKESNLFSPDVVGTLQKVFVGNQDINVRKAICKYFMKYMIYTCYQTADLKIIQKAIKEPIEIILGVEGQGESHKYLTECLGAEKGAYLEFLVEIIQPDIKKIEELVRALDGDNYSDFASQIRQEIISIKERLKSIEFISFNKSLVDIKKEIERRHEHYSRTAGKNIELSFKLEIQNTNASQDTWKEVHNFIFDILDIPNSSHLIGLCNLKLKGNNQSDFLLVRAEFHDTQKEDWNEVISEIKEKFADRGINASFIEKSDSFIVQKNFRVGEGEISTPFKKLFEFVVTTYAAPTDANYWKNIYRLAREEIRINSLNIQEKVENNLLLQISTLFSRAKDLIFIFMNEPHDLHHLCNSGLPFGDRSRRIDRVKENFKEISFFTRGFFSKKAKEEFSIIESMSRIIQEYEDISVFDNMQVKIIFEEKINDDYRFMGISDDIEMVIKNLFYNAFGALKKRNNLSGKFNPVINISIDKKDREYEILFSDNGIGIPGDKKVRDLIIDFAQKPENDEKSKSGIGLYIISTLVNCYQGDFDIKASRTGNNSGTTFFVRLPF